MRAPGVAHLRLGVDVAPHVGQVGALPQVLGGGLEHHLVAEPLGGRDRLVLGGRPGSAATGRCRRPPSSACSSSKSRSRPSSAPARIRETSSRAATRVDGLGGRPARPAAWPARRRTPPPGPARGPPPPRRGTTGPSRGPRCCRPRRAPAAARACPRWPGTWRPAACRTAPPPRPARRRPPRRVVFSGGMKTATTESTSASSMAASRASSKSSAVASAPSATGSLDLQPDRDRGVGGEQPERVGVADHGDPAAARQRLVGDQLGDVEHLVEGVDLDHPGLPEHRVDGGLRGQHRADRVAHRHALRGPARTSPRSPACGCDTRRASRLNLRGLPIDSR